MRPLGKPKALEQRRRRALELLESGQSYRAVAATVHSSVSSVVRWQEAYRAKGQAGLCSTPTPGRPAKLSTKEKEHFITILLRGPLSYRYTTDMWTLQRISDVIDKDLGVRYTLPNCWKLMRALGWSCQKPQKRAKGRNEEAIRTWKRWIWPQLKN